MPDAEAIIHPRPTLIVKAERDLLAHNRVWRQKGEGERARLCHTKRYHTLNREDLTRARQCMVAERGKRAGMAVPDTAASYTRPRGRLSLIHI